MTKYERIADFYFAFRRIEICAAQTSHCHPHDDRARVGQFGALRKLHRDVAALFEQRFHPRARCAFRVDSKNPACGSLAEHIALEINST